MGGGRQSTRYKCESIWANNQSGRQAGRRAVGLTGSTWGSLKCINNLNRERGNVGNVGGELGSWWTGTASLDLLTFRSFQTAPNANCNLISNPASGARSSMAIICCKYSLTLANTHTRTLWIEHCVYIGIITHTSRWPGQHFNFGIKYDAMRGRRGPTINSIALTFA